MILYPTLSNEVKQKWIDKVLEKTNHKLTTELVLEIIAGDV